jgi:hypothetical protein
MKDLASDSPVTGKHLLITSPPPWHAWPSWEALLTGER